MDRKDSKHKLDPEKHTIFDSFKEKVGLKKERRNYSDTSSARQHHRTSPGTDERAKDYRPEHVLYKDYERIMTICKDRDTELEKLRLTNETLRLDIQQLKQNYGLLEHENGKLTQNNTHLRKDTEHLKQENMQLRQESGQLRQHNGQLKKYNEQLKRNNEDFQQYNDQLAHDDEELRQNNEELMLDKGQLTRENEQLRQSNEQLIRKASTQEHTIEQLRSVAGASLTDNNPNLADLSDANRPTKLAEKYSEMYDNEWTEAFILLNEDVKLSEQDSITQLLSAFLELNEACVNEAREQLDQLTKAMAPFQETDSYSLEILSQLKDTRKRTFEVHLKRILPNVETLVRSILANYSVNDKTLRTFLMKCLQLSWLMAIQDPPVYVDKRVDRAGEKLDKAEFKVYTQSGKYIAFIVWPTVYLHQGGPMLCKGIAQGQTKTNTVSITSPAASTSYKQQQPQQKQMTHLRPRSRTPSGLDTYIKPPYPSGKPISAVDKQGSRSVSDISSVADLPELPPKKISYSTFMRDPLVSRFGRPHIARPKSKAQPVADQSALQPDKISYSKFMSDQLTSPFDDQSRDARSPNTAGPKSEAQQPKHKSKIVISQQLI